MNFVKFQRTPFLQSISGRLLLLLAFQKQPPEVFCEKNAFLKISQNHRKTPLACEIFKNIFFTEPLWTTAFWRKSTNDCFCTALAPVSYLSVLIYIQHILLHHQSPMFIFGSSSKGFKECKSGISFSRKSHFHCCYFLFPCFFSFSVLCHFFLSAAPKKDSFKLRVD